MHSSYHLFERATPWIRTSDSFSFVCWAWLNRMSHTYTYYQEQVTQESNIRMETRSHSYIRMRTRSHSYVRVRTRSHSYVWYDPSIRVTHTNENDSHTNHTCEWQLVLMCMCAMTQSCESHIRMRTCHMLVTHTYENVFSFVCAICSYVCHDSIIWVTHNKENQSHTSQTYERATRSHSYVWHDSIISVTHTNENVSCHMHDWVMSHIRIRHVAHTNQPRHTFERVMSHIHDRVMSPIRVSHVAHTN